MKTGKALVVGLAVCLAMAGVAFAGFNVDDEGVGFVGKGDVQLVFTWNNKALQDNADDVEFRVSSELVTEVSWICTNEKNEHTQERERTTTTTTEGVLVSVARVKNQITGFNLTGFEGNPIIDTETEGPSVDSCPEGPWVLTTPAGDPVPVGDPVDGIEVSIDGENWFPLGQE